MEKILSLSLSAWIIIAPILGVGLLINAYFTKSKKSIWIGAIILTIQAILFCLMYFTDFLNCVDCSI